MLPGQGCGAGSILLPWRPCGSRRGTGSATLPLGPGWGERLRLGSICGDGMSYSLYTHDSWGVLKIADFPSLDEARQAFGSLCEDPWYRNDGTVKGIELVQANPAGEAQRLDWFGFQ
jgi:hypothetical protein